MILSSGFIVMPLLIVENNIVNMIDNWQLYIPAMLLSFIGMLPLIILSERYKKTKPILLFCIALLILSQGMFFTLNLNFSVLSCFWPVLLLPLTQSKLYYLRFYPELQAPPSADLQWVFFQLLSS